MCEIYSKLSVKTPKRRRSGVSIVVNLKHILYIVLSVFIVNFKAGPQFWNPRNFCAWFSIYTTDWLKHRFLNEKQLRKQMLCLGRVGKINLAKRMKWAKDQSTFCKSYVFMEKFKVAQNKKFTEAATDIWTLRDIAKLLNISSITGTFQVFCLQFKNSFLKLYTVIKMKTISWVLRIVRSSSC